MFERARGIRALAGELAGNRRIQSTPRLDRHDSRERDRRSALAFHRRTVIPRYSRPLSMRLTFRVRRHA
jgi:hypothetical protein